jgi:parvulin-like peptidyl-prolyl isomerase
MIDHIRENTEVTEEDILDYYEENKTTSSQIQDPPRYSFSHIRTKTIESAQAALERINQGEDINTLARELSVYHDSRRGGKIDNLIERAIKTGYGREFLTALQEASTGDVIGPIKIRNDFYEVARLEGKLPARIKPLEEVKEQLRKTLLNRFQSRNIEEHLSALKKRQNAEILLGSSPSRRRPPMSGQ